MCPSLQAIGKERMPRTLHEGGPTQLDFSLILQQLQTTGHFEHGHMCSALVHMCGEVRFHLAIARVFYYVYFVFQPCDLKNIELPGGKTFSCQESCIIPRHVYPSIPSSSKLIKLLSP